jgi:UDPglucose--hexose-1-phosphate uridylyltransferase
MFRGDLRPADRELVTLRTAWRCGRWYEWVHHASLARRAGMTSEDVERTAEDADAGGWTPRERLLLRATDELHDRGLIGDATWAALDDELTGLLLADPCDLTVFGKATLRLLEDPEPAVRLASSARRRAFAEFLPDGRPRAGCGATVRRDRMAQARLDPLTGRWVIVAPARALRPVSVAAPQAGPQDGGRPSTADCPFCPGNEHLTPPEIARTGAGAAGTPGWRTRVVPNRYPIVGGPASGPSAADDPLRPERPVGGAHEVVVLSPDHGRSLGLLEPSQVIEVVTALRDRARAHAALGRASTQVFVNHGAEGGASLVHPHAQVIAVDLEPPAVAREAARMSTPEGCLICREVARHDRDAALVVAGTEGAEVWCPWASGTAFEMLLAPRAHAARFEDAEDDLPAVAGLLQAGLARLERAVPGAPYNVAVHSRPATIGGDYHWHVHVWPRLQREAGFERGSGLLVAVVDPARAAAALRG